MRLEDDELEALRRWGQALREAGGEELAPAGRAILMLLGEVERLRLELSLRRPSREDLPSGEVVADPGEALPSTLRGRLRRELAEGTGSDAEEQGSTTSPEAWIQSLRRPD
jgi:hypothetical protein